MYDDRRAREKPVLRLIEITFPHLCRDPHATPLSIVHVIKWYYLGFRMARDLSRQRVSAL